MFGLARTWAQTALSVCLSDELPRSLSSEWGLCWVTVGVGWRSNISEGRGRGLILEGWAVTFMGQRSSSSGLRGSGGRGEPRGIRVTGLRAWAIVHFTLICALGKQTTRSSEEKSASCPFRVLRGNQMRFWEASFPMKVRARLATEYTSTWNFSSKLSTGRLHECSCMQKVTWNDMIKTWLHRAGMATASYPCKHTAAPSSTQTHTHPLQLVWLSRLLTHARGSWLPATRLPRSLTPAQEAQQAGEQSSVMRVWWDSQSMDQQARSGLNQWGSHWVTLASKNNNGSPPCIAHGRTLL